MDKIKKALEALRNDLHHVPMTDRLASAFRHLDAALSALEGSKPKEHPRYVMIKDRYGELYELLCKGGVVYSIANIRTEKYPQPMWMRMDEEDLTIIGWCWGQTTERPTLSEFLAECARLNLEWIAVEPPKEQGAEPVAWMTEDGKEFVENWVREEWVKDNGPTAQFFIPRYPTPLYRHPQPLPAPTSREKAMEEAECTFYRDGHRIVQRLRGRDEFGDPQVTEQYMPVKAAIAMHEELGTALLSERSKPSLMVGFSEEEVRRQADEKYPGAHFDRNNKYHFLRGAKFVIANNRAVSIDRLMEEIADVLEVHGLGVEGNANAVLHADLRERLMKIMP